MFGSILALPELPTYLNLKALHCGNELDLSPFKYHHYSNRMVDPI